MFMGLDIVVWTKNEVLGELGKGGSDGRWVESVGYLDMRSTVLRTSENYTVLNSESPWLH